MESSRQNGSFDMEEFLECQLEKSPAKAAEPEDCENENEVDVEMVNPDTILEIDQILMEQSEKIAYSDENEMDTNEEEVEDSKMETNNSSPVVTVTSSSSTFKKIADDGKCTIEIKGVVVGAESSSSPSSNNPSQGQGVQDPIKPKRKKKKSRNGSIYVGVGNRIDWMALQTKFGFENVAYFATFVNETMRLLYDDFTKHCEQLKENREEIIGHKWISGLPVPCTKDGLINSQHQNTRSPSKVQVKEQVMSHLKSMGFEVEVEEKEKVRDQNQNESQEKGKLVEVTITQISQVTQDKKEQSENENENNSEGCRSQNSQNGLPELEYHGPLSVCEVVQDYQHLDLNDMERPPPVLQPITSQNDTISADVKSKPSKKKTTTKTKKAKKEKVVPVVPKAIPRKRGPKGKAGKKVDAVTVTISSNAEPAPSTAGGATITLISPSKEKLNIINLKSIKKREPKKGKKNRLPKNFINFDTSSNLFPTNYNTYSNENE